VLNALCCIKLPEISLTSHVKEIFLAINKSDSKDVKSALKRMCFDLYQSDEKPEGSSGRAAYGNVDKLVDEIIEIFDKSGHNREKIKTKLRSVMEALKKLKESGIKDWKKLSDFSAWLSDFQAYKFPSQVKML
jgi:hypothetical protein